MKKIRFWTLYKILNNFFYIQKERNCFYFPTQLLKSSFKLQGTLHSWKRPFPSFVHHQGNKWKSIRPEKQLWSRFRVNHYTRSSKSLKIISISYQADCEAVSFHWVIQMTRITPWEIASSVDFCSASLVLGSSIVLRHSSISSSFIPAVFAAIWRLSLSTISSPYWQNKR